MILGLGGHVEIWAAQALPLGAAFPPLHPCWKAGQLAMFSREVKGLDIYVQSTDFNASYLFFFPKKITVGMKSPQQYTVISLQSLQVFISHLELGVQWGQRGI